MYILQQIEWINFRTVEDTRLQTLQVDKFKIFRIPLILIGLETRLGWRTDRKFLRNPNLNEISTLVHSVIFVISLKLNIFPFSASILTFSMQNHLILTYFTHFDTTHLFYTIFCILYYNIYKPTRPATRRHFFELLYIRKFHLHKYIWNLASKSLRLKSVSCLVFPPTWIVSRDMNLNVRNT